LLVYRVDIDNAAADGVLTRAFAERLAVVAERVAEGLFKMFEAEFIAFFQGSSRKRVAMGKNLADAFDVGDHNHGAGGGRDFAQNAQQVDLLLGLAQHQVVGVIIVVVE
jgi:hypothetical protein